MPASAKICNPAVVTPCLDTLDVVGCPQGVLSTDLALPCLCLTLASLRCCPAPPNTGVVLVHCAQGISRSASILIGYLMARERLAYESALSALQGVRPVVQPNPGFVLQLQDWGRASCCLDSWQAWSKDRLDDCFAQVCSEM